MPTGVELDSIANEVLKSVGRNQVETWYPDLLKKRKALGPIDPVNGALVMASRFIPFVSAYLDQGGKAVLAEIGQQDASDWFVQSPQVLEAARQAVLDLCQETIDTFTRDLDASLQGIRQEVADSIATGEVLADTVNRVGRWISDNARWRARRIALTESARAYNQGQIAAVEDLDFVVGQELILSDDACPLCHAIFRACPKIPKGGTFGSNGNKPAYKDLKFPPYHPFCRCTLVPIFEGEAPKEWPQPVKPEPNGYIQPSEDDYAAAEAGGYETVAMGNAKSLGGFITINEG